MLVTGANGAGKTNLLEALHVGTQGFSPRTRADQQLVRFGATGSVALAGRPAPGRSARGDAAAGGKRAKLNGAALRSAEQLRVEVATLVFTPDRLAVVKGGPARRATSTRTLGRAEPGAAVEYAAAVGQNAALRRVQVGASTREAVAPWTEQVAALGAAGRVPTTRSRCSPAFVERAGELGLPDAALDYTGEPPTVARWRPGSSATSTAVSPASARTWTTSASARAARPAQLRLAGRAAPGRALAAARRGRGDRGAARDPAARAPRRRSLRARRFPADPGGGSVGRVGQAVVTATGADALPLEPAQLLEVTPGLVRVR